VQSSRDAGLIYDEQTGDAISLFLYGDSGAREHRGAGFVAATVSIKCHVKLALPACH